MNNRIISKINCCGCGMCEVVCPTFAITMKYNTGFPLPEIEEDKCIHCGRCYDHCPTNMKFKENNKVDAYGGWSLDSKNRSLSTSGGIAYEISAYLITKGYKFMGVRLSSNNLFAENYIAESVKDLDASRGSKYTTSRTVPALHRIKEKGKWVIVGTPCQIAGIDNYSRKNNRREEYVLIDMFCAGPATEKLLTKYVEEELEKDNQESQNIIDIKFRDKSKFGWSSTMRINYSDGSTNEIVDKSRSTFYKLFYSGATAKDSCYSCMYAKNISYADIRLGDYSGEKYKGNYEGVSAILAFTSKGKKLLLELNEKKIHLEETTEADINSAKLVKPKFKPRQRNKILDALDTDVKLEKICKKYVRPIIIERKIRRKTKTIKDKIKIKNIHT